MKKFVSKISNQDVLDYHSREIPGKLSIIPSKPTNSLEDLSIAYTPGVAIPCLEIKKNIDNIYKYTTKSNSVAVISNGTAVLGLGNIGAAASKPVMEGKSVLFKKFGAIDSIDLEIDTENIEEFINIVKHIGVSFGGINLEDIKSPDCFIIEEKLKELMDIPVFHDDQHGTAIVVAAGLINALYLTKRKISDSKIVVSGAGAASTACVNLLVKIGAQKNKIIVCDSVGVIYKGREKKMNEWKSMLATDTTARTLSEAMVNSDIFLGLSVKGVLSKEMLGSMAPDPIVFALANPDPEITPEDAYEVRNDIIMATGRSDYVNQVNNVMAFPYIFRAALDTRAKQINDEMKIAAAYALAELARIEVPEELCKIISRNNISFGKDYIIPSIFDSRLLTCIPLSIAKAAIDSKVVRNNDFNLENYKEILKAFSKNLS